MVDGAFDPLHRGHIEYFRAAAALGVPLLCNVASDRYVRTKHPPLLPEDQRAAIVDAIRYITYTHINQFDTETILRELRPRYYVKGKDWEGRLPAEQVDHLRASTASRSSTSTPCSIRRAGILEQFTEEQRHHSMTITEFEAARPRPEAGRSTALRRGYFTGDWRAGGNNYYLETRRQIEAKNPQLIKDVFQPKRVLDLGCGPGALMHLLWELGVDVDGIDFAESSRSWRRRRCATGSPSAMSTDPTLKPAGAYDLVICREVLEHLTVLQVKQAVANMVRMTSKFIYVTTRFHPNPPSLLDFTTQFDV